jgi:RIO-like serine/threonine protein kinase
LDYFEHIVSRLTLDDMQILAMLSDKDFTASFKAVKKKEIFELLGFSEANYRKTIYRLDALNFIETLTGVKEHKIYITNYGLLAIQKSLEGDDE